MGTVARPGPIAGAARRSQAVGVHSRRGYPGYRVPGEPCSGQYRFPMAVPTGREGSPPVVDPGADDWTPDEADWLADDASEPSGLPSTAGDPGQDSDPASSGGVTSDNVVFDQEVADAVAGPSRPTRRMAKKAKRAKRRAREQRRKQLAKRFAPRRRILPRTVIGICLLLLSTALAVGAISAALYMNYAFKKDRSEALVQGLDRRIQQRSEEHTSELQSPC